MNLKHEEELALTEIFNLADLALFEATAHLNFRDRITPSMDAARKELLESRYGGELPLEERKKRDIQMKRIPKKDVQQECIKLTIGIGLEAYAKELAPSLSIGEQKEITHQVLGNIYNVFAAPYGVPFYAATFTDSDGYERPLQVQKQYVADITNNHPSGYSFFVNYTADDGRILATVHESPDGTSFAGIQA